MMSDDSHHISVEEAAYDAVPYSEDPHFWSEPSLFSAAAALHGFTPVPLKKARILEIGCAGGANIIPMALRYPDAFLYGFDISKKQIANAQAHAQEIILPNLAFAHADILQIPKDIGSFDYIIAHGIASWIPSHVREALWSACATLLNENGLLYLSYNALPGWHFKRSVRDMLKFRLAERPINTETMTDLIAYFDEIEAHASGIHKQLLQIEKKFIQSDNAQYIAHDYLEAENHAFYVEQILQEANTHSLSYICEADPTSSNLELLPEKVARSIVSDARGNRAQEEQSIDFHVNRAFRRSVFAKISQTGNLTRSIDIDAMDDLHIIHVDMPNAAVHANYEKVFFTFPKTFFDETNDEYQLRKQLLALETIQYLKAQRTSLKSTISVSDVLAHCGQGTSGDPKLLAVIRMSILELLYRRNFAISTMPVSWSSNLEMPRVQPQLRSDAAHGRSSSVNVLHEKITLTSNNSRLVMSLLDGTRDRKTIVEALLALYEAGRFTLAEDSEQTDIATRVNNFLDTFLTKIDALKLLC